MQKINNQIYFTVLEISKICFCNIQTVYQAAKKGYLGKHIRLIGKSKSGKKSLVKHYEKSKVNSWKNR